MESRFWRAELEHSTLSKGHMFPDNRINDAYQLQLWALNEFQSEDQLSS